MILRKGDKNVRVIELQKLLKSHGFFNNPTFTQFFGPVTENSVINFQKSRGLLPDGVVGNRTWDALSSSKVNLSPLITGGKDEDLEDDFDITKLPKIDGKYPTSNSAIELVKFIKDFKLTRNIEEVIWHCTASNPNATVKQIVDYHLNSLKWSRPGYHILIDARGQWSYVTDFNLTSNGVAGRNSRILNICYIGGIDNKVKPLDTRTPEQLLTMELVYKALKDKLPKAKHFGHYKYAKKACPSFNVENWILQMK